MALLGSEFIHAYAKRLHIPSLHSMPADVHTLQTITEAHLQHIPFENISQHGGERGGEDLTLPGLYDKILQRDRGGNCFELSLLLAHLLQLLGYDASLLFCRVYAGKERGRKGFPGFRKEPGHCAVLVGLPNSPHIPRLFVDVGFGEPPLGPLRYTLDEEQITSEGMCSRIISLDCCAEHQLEWCIQGTWLPRLRWSVREAATDASPVSREALLTASARLRTQGSTFSRKLVCCRLTRHDKLTISGSRLKRTSPRFGPAAEVKVTEIHFSCLSEVRNALMEHFNIPLLETERLDICASRNAPLTWWEHL